MNKQVTGDGENPAVTIAAGSEASIALQVGGLLLLL